MQEFLMLALKVQDSGATQTKHLAAEEPLSQGLKHHPNSKLLRKQGQIRDQMDVKNVTTTSKAVQEGAIPAISRMKTKHLIYLRPMYHR